MAQTPLVEGSQTEISVSSTSSGTYVKIPGIEGWDGSEAGAAPRTDIVTVEGSVALVGKPPVGEVSFSCNNFLRHLEVWEDVHEAWKDGTPMFFRIDEKTTRDDVLTYTSGTTITVSTGGVATASASASFTDHIQPGMVLYYDVSSTQTYFTITEVDSDTVLNVVPAPSTASGTQSTWGVLHPSLRTGPFEARILEISTAQTAQGQRTATVRLSPSEFIGDPSILDTIT